MKKILALITSPIHLMEMVNLLQHDFQGITCDIAIDDYLKNAEILVRNSKTIKLFNKVFLISYKKYNNETGKYGAIIAKLLRNIYPTKKRIQKNLKYDYPEMDFDYDTICFYDTWNFNNYIALSQNNVTNYIWLDDGFCSYTGVAFFNKGKFADKIRSLLRVNFLRDNITEQFLFHPELKNFKSDFECRKLQTFDVHDEEFKKTINTIFGINELFNISQKYIYIDDPYNECGGKITNKEVLNLFIPYIQKKDLIIKMHPRCDASQYENEYQILKANGIPWEIIFLNMYNTKHLNTLIGVFSYALVTPFLIFGEKSPILVLLNMIDEKKLDDTTLRSLPFIKKIFNTFPDVFFQPKNAYDLQSIIQNINQ